MRCRLARSLVPYKRIRCPLVPVMRSEKEERCDHLDRSGESD
jgi:hypothetical protein